MRTTPPADPSVSGRRKGPSAEYRKAIHEGIALWQGLGVPTLPVPLGEKGPRVRYWPVLPFDEAWRRSRDEAERSPINLAIRTGATASGRYLAAIDIDGKCRCGHDLATHKDGSSCTSADCSCRRYRGCHPDDAREQLLGRLPPGVAVTATNRGYHLLVWTARPLPDGPLPDLGADLFGGEKPHALMVPPSRHPSGTHYSYLAEPGDQIPIVDLENLDLAPADRVRETLQDHHHPGPSLRGFADLLATLGIRPGEGDRTDAKGEFFICLWHPDTEASLHIRWLLAVFFCFGCKRAGGERKLRDLVPGRTTTSPRMFPVDDRDIPSGEGGTFGGAEELSERIATLVDQLPPRTFNVSGRQLRECRRFVLTYTCGAGHDLQPAASRARPAPVSCDASASICPRCGPGRFLRVAGAADEGLPEWVHVFRLVARTPGRALFDPGLGRRLNGRLKAYRRSHDLVAGSAACSLHLDLDDSVFHGHFIVAVPPRIGGQVVADGAFVASDLSECSLDEWHEFQMAERVAALSRLRTAEQLEACYSASHGQQRFRHFGDWYGRRSPDGEAREISPSTATSGVDSGGRRLLESVSCSLHPRAPVWLAWRPAPRLSPTGGDGHLVIPAVRGLSATSAYAQGDPP